VVENNELEVAAGVKGKFVVAAVPTCTAFLKLTKTNHLLPLKQSARILFNLVLSAWKGR
jgi:hypothetical protein